MLSQLGYWNPALGLANGLDRSCDTRLRRLGNLLRGLGDVEYGVNFPAVNVRSTDSEAVVTVELPGFEQENIDVSVAGETLTVKASRKADEKKEGVTIHRVERVSGEFVRTLRLPFRVDSGAVTATYKNGILSVTLPKTEAEKPRKITVAR